MLAEKEIDELCQVFRDGAIIDVNPITWQEMPEDWKNIFRLRMKSALIWLEEKGKLK
jgi:hypothetical protein